MIYTQRPYQREGTEFMLSRYSTLCADQPRLGKTFQAVQAWNPVRGRLGIFAPLAVRPVWLTWIKRVHGDVRVAVCKGRKFDEALTRGADAIFCHYDILYDWMNMRGEFSQIVYDEPHLLYNWKTKRAEAARVMSMRARDRVIALTGTPLWNKPARLWGLLHLIANDGRWGTFKDFSERYANGRQGTYGWETGEPDNVEELQERLKDVMIRRTWADVIGDLPAVDRSVEVCELNRKTRLAIDQEMMAAQVGGEEQRSVLVGENARLRKIVAKFKVKPTVRCAEEFLRAGEPCVIWVWHRDVAWEIAKKLDKWGPFVITGDTPSIDREYRLKGWKTRCAPLILNLAVGQVGIDLSHARHAIFAELDYTPAVMSQAEMRTFDPNRPMTITYIVADHLLERQLVSVVREKCQNALAMGVPASDTPLDVLASAFDLPEKAVDWDAIGAYLASMPELERRVDDHR